MLFIRQTITAMKRLNQEQTQNLMFFKFFVAIIISILLWKASTDFWKKENELSLQKSVIQKMTERVQITPLSAIWQFLGSPLQH
ncbi:MAG: hypothetical protein RMJ97_03765 [Raineya sp.]|nr:hypothetical protein [Raineya sp.]MDW8295979.1 hypothetical protein [Raineya sp.]